MVQVDPSATVMGDGALCGWKLEKILVLPMWFVELGSITHLFEKVIRHAFPDSTKVVTEVDSLSDFWYWMNLA